MRAALYQNKRTCLHVVACACQFQICMHGVCTSQTAKLMCKLHVQLDLKWNFNFSRIWLVAGARDGTDGYNAATVQDAINKMADGVPWQLVNRPWLSELITCTEFDRLIMMVCIQCNISTWPPPATRPHQQLQSWRHSEVKLRTVPQNQIMLLHHLSNSRLLQPAECTSIYIYI